MGKLERTDVIIVARTIDDDGYRLAYLPVTLMASLAAVMTIVTVAVTIFATLDRVAVPVFDFVFVGWVADLALIWLAFRLMIGWRRVRA